MVKNQHRSKRSSSGAKYIAAHKKRKHRLGRPPIETNIGKVRKKFVRVRGGNTKIKLYSSNKICVAIPDKNETKVAEIQRLEENNASKDYQRRNIMTKGAIVETDLGLVRITSRPGQNGSLNGVLLEK